MGMEAAEGVGKSWGSQEGCCRRTVWGEARGRQPWGGREPPDLMGLDLGQGRSGRAQDSRRQG